MNSEVMNQKDSSLPVSVRWNHSFGGSSSPRMIRRGAANNEVTATNAVLVDCASTVRSSESDGRCYRDDTR
jgi:hypothetical protein